MPPINDLMDLSAVGNAARAPKGKSAAPKELTDFSVKKGDNGGVLVCENYRSKTPEGRRAGISFPGGGDYKENPFGPEDGAKATAHIQDLLSQMTNGAMAAPEEEPVGPEGPPMPPEGPAGPPMPPMPPRAAPRRPPVPV